MRRFALGISYTLGVLFLLVFFKAPTLLNALWLNISHVYALEAIAHGRTHTELVGVIGLPRPARPAVAPATQFYARAQTDLQLSWPQTVLAVTQGHCPAPLPAEATAAQTQRYAVHAAVAHHLDDTCPPPAAADPRQLADYFWHRADELSLADHEPEVWRDLSISVAFSPHNAAALVLLGDLSRQRGDLDAAARHAEAARAHSEALEQDPVLQGNLSLLQARIARADGRPAAACTWFDQLLALPDYPIGSRAIEALAVCEEAGQTASAEVWRVWLAEQGDGRP